jgi:hypothetical protein
MPSSLKRLALVKPCCWCECSRHEFTRGAKPESGAAIGYQQRNAHLRQWRRRPPVRVLLVIRADEDDQVRVRGMVKRYATLDEASYGFKGKNIPCILGAKRWLHSQRHTHCMLCVGELLLKRHRRTLEVGLGHRPAHNPHLLLLQLGRGRQSDQASDHHLRWWRRLARRSRGAGSRRRAGVR